MAKRCIVTLTCELDPTWGFDDPEIWGDDAVMQELLEEDWSAVTDKAAIKIQWLDE